MRYTLEAEGEFGEGIEGDNNNNNSNTVVHEEVVMSTPFVVYSNKGNNYKPKRKDKQRYILSSFLSPSYRHLALLYSSLFYHLVYIVYLGKPDIKDCL